MGTTLRAAAAALLMGAVGCTLVTDLDGFADDTAASTLAEGGTKETDAALAEAGVPDAPPTILPQDGGGPSPCAAQHRFCDDFDVPALKLPGKWDMKHESAGPLSIDGALSVSSPSSLKVSFGPGPGDRSSFVEKGFTTSAKVVELAYDLRVATFGPGPYKEVDFGNLMFEPLASGFQDQGLSVIKYASRWVFEYFRHKSGGGYEITDIPINVTFDAWHRITIRIDFNGTPTGTLLVDGTSVASVPLDTTSLNRVQTQLGVNYSQDANTSTTVNVDNVTIDEL